jgi:hypothetical protein
MANRAFVPRSLLFLCRDLVPDSCKGYRGAGITFNNSHCIGTSFPHQGLSFFPPGSPIKGTGQGNHVTGDLIGASAIRPIPKGPRHETTARGTGYGLMLGAPLRGPQTRDPREGTAQENPIKVTT